MREFLKNLAPGVVYFGAVFAILYGVSRLAPFMPRWLAIGLYVVIIAGCVVLCVALVHYEVNRTPDEWD